MEKILKEIVKAFPGKRVLVVGDVMLDEFIWGEAHRISPEAPVPIVVIHQRTHLPGGAANTAVNVAGLGGEALLGGVVGEDRLAATLRQTLVQRGVGVDGLMIDIDRITTAKTRVLAQGKHVVRLDEENQGALSEQTQDKLLAWVAREMATADACILSDYAKGIVSARFAQRFLELARQADKPTVVDPKGSNLSRFRGATVIKPNLNEAQRICQPGEEAEFSVFEIGRRLLANLGGSHLLITRGPEGMSLFRAGSEPLSIPSFARAVFDVTGAGDTVAGTLALALATGADMEHAAYLANRAAGIVVGKVGTAAVTREELLADLETVESVTS